MYISLICIYYVCISQGPRNVAESSKGLKLPMCLQDRFAASVAQGVFRIAN